MPNAYFSVNNFPQIYFRKVCFRNWENNSLKTFLRKVCFRNCFWMPAVGGSLPSLSISISLYSRSRARPRPHSRSRPHSLSLSLLLASCLWLWEWARVPLTFFLVHSANRPAFSERNRFVGNWSFLGLCFAFCLDIFLISSCAKKTCWNFQGFLCFGAPKHTGFSRMSGFLS